MNRSLFEFFAFVQERQAIWHRRHVLGQAFPWTDDPILQRYKFTNVYRQLDPGTTQIVGDLKARVERYNPYELLRNAMLYRVFNNRHLWPEIAWKPYEHQVEAVRQVVARFHVHGEKVFGNAWAITGGSSHPTTGERMTPGQRVMAAMKVWPEQLGRVVGSLKNRQPIGHLYQEIRRLEFGGKVVSWQVALDLAGVYPHLSDDEWLPKSDISKLENEAHGHGPAMAARLILPETPFREAVEEIRDAQEHYLSTWWQEIHPPKLGPRLSLANIEHSLCEFMKYEGVRVGRRVMRRYHPPATDGQVHAEK
jgi:hypothetical protein